MRGGWNWLKDHWYGYYCYPFPDARLLAVIDDSAGHGIVSSRDAARNILINGGSIKSGGRKAYLRQRRRNRHLRLGQQRQYLGR
jgi:hypothetical protein